MAVISVSGQANYFSLRLASWFRQRRRLLTAVSRYKYNNCSYGQAEDKHLPMPHVTRRISRNVRFLNAFREPGVIISHGTKCKMATASHFRVGGTATCFWKVIGVWRANDTSMSTMI